MRIKGLINIEIYDTNNLIHCLFYGKNEIKEVMKITRQEPTPIIVKLNFENYTHTKYINPNKWDVFIKPKLERM